MESLDKPIVDANLSHSAQHDFQLEASIATLRSKGIELEDLLQHLQDFQVAVPSWALGSGGTRFGRFSIGGEPRNLAEKISDVGLLQSLTRSTDSISLHIPWDFPKDPGAIAQFAQAAGIQFDAVNSNTFQDQPDQLHSYKFGSLGHATSQVRAQAIAHNKHCIDIGQALGSKSLTVWLADGSSFPGQLNFREALVRTLDSLQQIYDYMPRDWKLFIEYKPYEPNFYSTVVADWGTSYLLADACGDRAFTLVDLGHHLPNTNIEQIVATLLWKGKLGGFHFNDSKYGDDDLTAGSIKPYQLFLIFNELVGGMAQRTYPSAIAWMIDASHNLKDPLEDLIQSLEAIRLAYAQALIVDREGLADARQQNDVTRAQEILQDAYRTDLRAVVRETRRSAGGALYPIELYRSLGVRQRLIEQRGSNAVATGL